MMRVWAWEKYEVPYLVDTDDRKEAIKQVCGTTTDQSPTMVPREEGYEKDMIYCGLIRNIDEWHVEDVSSEEMLRIAEEKLPKKLSELATDAERVQDASNLSGVVHAMSRVASELWKHAREEGKGTDWVNTHPVMQAYVMKLLHLSELGGEIETKEVARVFDAVHKMANPDVEESIKEASDVLPGYVG